MKIEDLTVEVRNSSFERLGQLSPADLVGLTIVARYCNVGSWTLTLPSSSRMVDALRTPGSGIIVTAYDQVIFSGYTTAAKLEQSTDNSVGDWVLEGVDDSIILAERLAYPYPASSDVAAQLTEADVRAGNAETVIKGYVTENISASAVTDRAIAALTVEADQGRGDIVSASARFESLQDLLYGLAQTGKIGFRVEQAGDGLEFQVYEPVDRSQTIRMDVDNGRLTKTEYVYGQPKITRAIVGGAGEGVARVFYQGSSTDSLAAETVWSRRVERFVDGRGSNDEAALIQSANEALVDDGKTIVNTSVTPSDDQTMRYGIDWNLGDKVTVVVGLVETTAVVTEIGLNIAEDGVRIGATLGTPAPVDFESKLVSAQINQAQRISNLERNNNTGAVMTYSPVWSGTGLAYTGSPVTGSYTRIGQLVHFRITVACNTVTSFGTGQYFLTLPVEPVADYIFRDGGLHEGANHYSISADAEGGSLDLEMYYPSKSAGNQVVDAAFTATAPKTLATSDYFYVSGTYLAATN